MIISIDAENSDKIQHPFLIKALMKLGIEGIYLNIKKAIYEKPKSNIILNGEKLKPFTLKSGMKQGFLLSLHLFLASAIRRKEEIKGNQIVNEDVILSLFVEDMFLYLKHSKISSPKLLDILNFRKVSVHKIHIQQLVTVPYTNKEQTEKEFKETFPFAIASKKTT
jgi:hypothetical protein